MAPQGTPNSPFNFIQVAIAALGAGYLNVIIFFIGGSAGASMQIGETSHDVVHFAQVLGYTWASIVALGLVVFLLGRAQKGITKVAQWIGLVIAVASIAFPIMNSADVATAITLSLIHIMTGVAWFFAVHYGNKKLHTEAQALAIA
ncbi:hypothetical protein DFO58_2733 [Arthrobacter sp. AG1021]|uniref:DUF6069 family protein n=1 Tax=Arthrobacter sp. AG1021 TaxID=2183908 RepID=UPI000EABA206|nr:DUF6069 family protein [Arthrobacter sp. AG1021]RKS18373.1 hypothetical protein DFO58_2733 [Arthrobacter sp. AG1021]